MAGSDGAPHIEIEYCTECGFLLRAAWIAQELLRALETEIGDLALKPGSGGNFIIRLDGVVLFSRREQGRFPEAKELKLLVGSAIGSGRRFGHGRNGGDPDGAAD
ncbi:MAG: Rdx family protein [Acidiferrobacterales bacterium]